MKNQDEFIREELDKVDVPPPPPEFFDSLQQSLQTESFDAEVPTSVSKHHWRRIAATSSVSVAAAAVVVALIANSATNPSAPTTGTSLAQPTSSVPTTPTTEIQTLLASQVVARMTTAIADIKTLSATVEVVQHPYAISVDGEAMVPGHTLAGTMRLRSDGSSLIDYTKGWGESHGPQVDAYNAKTGVSESCWKYESQWSCSVNTGLIAPYTGTQGMLGLQTFSSLVRNLLSVQDTAVESAVFDDRPVWKFHSKLPTSDASFGNEGTVYVDQETSIPLRVEIARDGKAYSETTVTNLKVNPPLTDGDFALQRPAGAQVNEPFSNGYTRTTIGKLPSQIGYVPLVPTLPAGFQLAEVSFAKNLGPAGPEGLNPENNDVAVLTYRRGLQSVTFTTRRTGSGHEWLDPFAPEYDTVISDKKVTLSSGAFAGTSVHVKTSSYDQRLWGVGSKLVLAVVGDLTADEMIAAANSLQRHSG